MPAFAEEDYKELYFDTVSKLSETADRVGTLEQQLADMKPERIAALEEELRETNIRLGSVANEVEEWQEEFEELEEEYWELDEYYKRLAQQNRELKTDISNLNAIIQEQINVIYRWVTA